MTSSVHAAFYGDSRYRPSHTQKQLVDAQWLGRKSGRGFYAYSDGQKVEPAGTPIEGVAERILAMLMNEAADAVFWQIASPQPSIWPCARASITPKDCWNGRTNGASKRSSTFSNRWDNATAKGATGSLPCCETSQERGANSWVTLPNAARMRGLTPSHPRGGSRQSP